MLDMISAGLGSLSTAKGLIKSMRGLNEEVAVNLKAAELLTIIADVQGSLNDANAKIFELQRELREAREELGRRAALDRYRLCEPYGGSFVFKLDENLAKEGEPMHYICPVCKDDGVIGILDEPTDRYAHNAVCQRCERRYQMREVRNRPVRSTRNPYA